MFEIIVKKTSLINLTQIDSVFRFFYVSKWFCVKTLLQEQELLIRRIFQYTISLNIVELNL